MHNIDPYLNAIGSFATTWCRCCGPCVACVAMRNTFQFGGLNRQSVPENVPVVQTAHNQRLRSKDGCRRRRYANAKRPYVPLRHPLIAHAASSASPHSHTGAHARKRRTTQPNESSFATGFQMPLKAKQTNPKKCRTPLSKRLCRRAPCYPPWVPT